MNITNIGDLRTNSLGTNGFLAKINYNSGQWTGASSVGSEGFDSIRDIVIKDDFLYVVGDFSGTVDFGSGISKTSLNENDRDPFLGKLDSDWNTISKPDYY